MLLQELFESSVTVNRTLNPKLWVGDKLKPEISAKLKEIADAFSEFIGIDLDISDYTITGSNANYTWTEFSDLDLHLIVPGMPDATDRELFNAKKALWNENHSITIKELPVEVYVQGSKEPHHSTGVYSIIKDTWLVKPQKTQPQVDDASVKAKLDSLAHDIAHILRTDDLEAMRRVKERITKMRRAGLARAGEWSVENLVFKQLRNQGLIDQLADRVRSLEDEQLSLAELARPLD